MSEELLDIGVFLEVPKEKRLKHDDCYPQEDNEDEFKDLSHIEPGKVVKLSTAHLDKEL